MFKMQFTTCQFIVLFILRIENWIGQTWQFYNQMFILGMVTSSLVVILVAAVLFYRHILKTLRDNKIKELLEGNKCQDDPSCTI